MRLSIDAVLRAKHYYQLGEYEQSLCYAKGLALDCGDTHRDSGTVFGKLGRVDCLQYRLATNFAERGRFHLQHLLR